MKILIAIESFYDGGAEMAAIRLANGLLHEGNKVFFIELRSNLSKKKKHLKLLAKDIPIWQPEYNIIVQIGLRIHFPIPKVNRYKRALLEKYTRLYLKFKLWINRIEIINSHYLTTDEYFGLIKGKRKLVSTFHGHYELFHSKNQSEQYKRRLGKSIGKLDHIVYSTDKHIKILELLGTNYVNKISRIFYGFQMPIQIETKLWTDGPLIVTIVSRCIKEKGWKELIQSVIVINTEVKKQVMLNLVGDGEFRSELEHEFGHIDGVKFLGEKTQEEIYHIISDSHVTALPTYYIAESMPNSIIEYLSYGKPVIATDIGAINEMIQTSEGTQAGVLVELKNGQVFVEDLVRALKIYLNDHERLASDSRAAFNAREKFDIENCTSKYMELFKKIKAVS